MIGSMMLGNAPRFPGRQVRKLPDYLSMMQFDDGEQLTANGEANKWFGVVLQGQVTASRTPHTPVIGCMLLLATDC